MAEMINFNSCQRRVPYEPDCTGHVTLTAPPGLDRSWPKTPNGKSVAVLCASCVTRLSLHLFGPSARREPLTIDPDAPGPRLAIVEGDHAAAPAARGA